MSRGRLFDPMTPPERTSMAWERTAFSGMAVGLLMTRLGATVHLGAPFGDVRLVDRVDCGDDADTGQRA